MFKRLFHRCTLIKYKEDTTKVLISDDVRYKYRTDHYSTYVCPVCGRKYSVFIYSEYSN